jgi:hypothetical protein
VIENVLRTVDLVAAIANGKGLGAHGPKASQRREINLLCVMGRFFLGDTNPMTGVVVRNFRKNVEVDVGHARNGNLKFSALEGLHEQSDN